MPVDKVLLDSIRGKDGLADATTAATWATTPGNPLNTAITAAAEEAAEEFAGDYSTGTNKIIYVSTLTGSDTNTGLDQAHPVATFDKAYTLIGVNPGTINLAQGESFSIDKTYRLDTERHKIVGQNSRIDTTDLAENGTAFVVHSTLSGTQFQPWTVIQGVEIANLTSPAYDSTVSTKTAIKFDNDGQGTKRGPSHTYFRDIAIRGFKVGVEFGDQVYCTTFDGFQIGNCLRAIYVPLGLDNSGEKLTWMNGTIFNSQIAVDARHTTGELFFFAVSFDYINTQIFHIENSIVTLYGCHVEFSNDLDTTPDRPVILPTVDVSGNSGSFIMYGGQFKCGTASNPVSIPVFIRNNAAWRNLSMFNGVMFHNIDVTTSGDFADGSGRTVIVHEKNYGGATRSWYSLGDANSMLADGGFQESTFVDDWFIYEGGGNMTAAYSTSYSYAGGQCLRLGKVAGTNAPAQVALAVPMSRGAMPHVRFFQKHPGSGSGTLYVSYYAAIMKNGVFLKLEQLGGTTNEAMGTPEPDWTRRYLIATQRMPAWSTHFVVNFNLTNVGAGNAYFIDAMTVNES